MASEDESPRQYANNPTQTLGNLYYYPLGSWLRSVTDGADANAGESDNVQIICPQESVGMMNVALMRYSSALKDDGPPEASDWHGVDFANFPAMRFVLSAKLPDEMFYFVDSEPTVSLADANSEEETRALALVNARFRNVGETKLSVPGTGYYSPSKGGQHQHIAVSATVLGRSVKDLKKFHDGCLDDPLVFYRALLTNTVVQ